MDGDVHDPSRRSRRAGRARHRGAAAGGVRAPQRAQRPAGRAGAPRRWRPGAWQGWAVRSLAHWLTWQAGISPHRADEVVRLAEARTTAPGRDGGVRRRRRCRVDQAAIATKAPAYLDERVRRAGHVGHRRPAAGDGRAARPPGRPPTRRRPSRTRSLATWFDDDGRLPPPRRARCRPRPHRRRRADRSPRRRCSATGRPRCRGPRRSSRWPSARWTARPPSGGSGSGSTGSSTPTDPVPARWTDGLAVPDWLRDQLLCDGTVRPDVHRRRQAGQRRAQRSARCPNAPAGSSMHRDRKCRVPWCTQTRWLQVHHVVHDEHGGPTDTCEPRRPLPGRPPPAPPRPARHHRRRRRPERADVHRRPRRVIDPATRPRKPTGRHPTGRALRAPTRGAARRSGDHVPRSARRTRRPIEPRRELRGCTGNPVSPRNVRP